MSPPSLSTLIDERVEVLKDGASAEYGSDAIAGVVNIILKKSFTGAEFGAEAGQSQHHDGTMTHLSAIWGTGDLDADGHNFYVSPPSIAVRTRYCSRIAAANTPLLITRGWAV